MPLAWGIEDVGVGTLSTIEPAKSISAARLVTSGRRVNLDLPLHLPLSMLPPHSHRFRDAPVHELDKHSYQGLPTRDDRFSFHPQASSQWDGLAHIGDPKHGFYNGATSEDINLRDGSKNGVDKYAEFGIFTRGVYVDLPRFYASRNETWDCVGSQSCPASDLDQALAQAGITPEAGDVLCVRTGWLEAFRAAGEDRKAELFQGRDYSGLAGDARMWELLWDYGFAAVVSDSVTVEVWPLEVGKSSLHLAIARLGLVLGEMLDLDALQAAVDLERRNSFLFVAKPLNIRGGIGSPANAMAVF